MKLICLYAFMIPIACIAQKDCLLKLDKDSIRVYTCDQGNSRFKTIKATFHVNSRLSQLAATVLDIDFYKEWQYNTLSTSVLEKVSEREIIYHTEVAAPLFTSNRDFVIRLTINKDPLTNGLTIDAVSIPDYIPPLKGVIRVPYSSARWEVRSIGPTKLLVEYTIDIDLGGAVPPWLVNMVAPQAPYETFKSFREKINKYADRSVPFIRD